MTFDLLEIRNPAGARQRAGSLYLLQASWLRLWLRLLLLWLRLLLLCLLRLLRFRLPRLLGLTGQLG